MPILNGSTLTLYGMVGAGLFEGEFFTAKDVRAALDTHGPGDLTVNLNSGGGLGLEGIAIFNTLKAHAGKITIIVDAIAASAASIVAMAGDEIVMRDGALIMIHDPRMGTMGTARDHRKSASVLDTLSEQYRQIYAQRSGLTPAEVGTLMDAETWMDADRAIELGFATRKADEAALEIAAFDYRVYRNAPPSLTLTKGPMLMPIAAPDELASDKPWASSFFRAAQNSGLPIDRLNDILASAASLPLAKDALIDAMASADKLLKPRFTPGGGQRFDNPEFRGNAIVDALYARMTGKAVEGPAAEWAGRSMLDIGAAILAANGERVSWSNRDHLAGRIMSSAGSHSTSDFPQLLTGAGNRVLLDAYKSKETPLKLLAARRTANDFRALSALKLGETPKLLQVAEGGEVTYGTRAEEKESFRLRTFARIFSLTRQALINDDLGAFSDSLRLWGGAAAECEATELVALISGNGANMDDNAALYTTVRGNKAGSGGTIDVTTLGAGRKVMREMKGVDGLTPISVTPKHLVVGAAKETEAEQVLATLAAAEVANANPFSGKLTLHVESRLTGNSWRLFADPAELAVLNVAYLGGQQAPVMEMKQGWTVLGTEFRAVLDFGCGLVDWRGTYLNPGN